MRGRRAARSRLEPRGALKVRRRTVSEKCASVLARGSSVFRSYAVLSFQSPKSILKEEHNSQRIEVQDGSAQACREYSKSREYRREAVATRRRIRLVPFVLPFSESSAFKNS